MTASPAPLPPRGTWRRRGHGRLVLAVVAPVLALVAFGSYAVQGKLESYRHSGDLLASARLARAAHFLAHELQEERGLSAIALNSGRAEGLEELEDQRESTNARLEAFRRLASAPQTLPLIGTDRRGTELGEIDSLRAGVDAGGDLKSLLAGYDRLVGDLLAAVARLPTGESHRLTAYTDLGNLRDRLARADALGMAIIGGGRSGRDLLPLLIQAHAEAKAFTESFRAHAFGEPLGIAETLAADPAAAAIEALLVRAKAGRLTAADAADWRAAFDAFAERASDSEDRLAAAIEGEIGERLTEAKRAFYIVLLAALALVGFALETLRRSERRAALAEDVSRMLFRAVEQSPVAVMITDPTGRIEYVNAAFTAMTGFERDEVIGRFPSLLRTENTPDETFADMWRTITAGREWRGELCNRRKDGGLYWESMTVAPVRGIAGDIVNYIALKEDVSERRAAAEAQAAARQAAELANRAKSEFLAAMSHELRTPLNAVIGFSDMIAAQPYGELAPRYLEHVGDINRSGRHLLQLIDDILDVARLDVGQVTLREEEIDVETVVSAATQMVRERAVAGGIDFVVTVPPGLPNLWVDARRLKQVLVNVLANAIKFTPTGGRVEIAAAMRPEGGLAFTVADTGIGIAAEQLARVMSPFVQADSGMARRYEGSGLGLPLARQLIELHGGAVHLESVLGRGTTVTLALPPERLRAGSPSHPSG